jgi:hypothetical protein
LFAPGCLSGSRARRARLPRDLDALEAALNEHSPLSLQTVEQLLSEAVVEPEFCRALYRVAQRLARVEVIDAIVDQHGRAGQGLARIEHVHRIELIFSSDISELLGYQHVLVEPQPFAPVGTLHSWSVFLDREVVDDLPAGTPPVPDLPCAAGAGRGFVIRPGFHVMTGYVTDPLSQLARMKAQGVITDAEYESARANATNT